MIMLTVTKPRRKLKRLLQGGALLLLLGAVVPGIYYSLQTVGAMSLFASGDAVSQSEQLEQTGPMEQAEPTEQAAAEEYMAEQNITEPNAAEENIEVEKEPGILARLQAVLFGEKAEVKPY